MPHFNQIEPLRIRRNRCDETDPTRTYSPLLEAYSRLDGRLQDCMEIWRDGVSPNQGLTMTEREYLHLIAACTRARHEEW